MVLVQNWPFFYLFFLGILGEENVVYGILERKNAFLCYKNSIFKKWKICDFWKGVNPWFWSKIGHFSICFFLSLQARKMCFTIVQNEKAPFQAIKTACSKSGKIGHFSIFFSQAIQASKMCFTIFQNEKTPFMAIKTASSKSGKFEIFAKGLTHGFGLKFAIFPCFVFRQYRPGKSVLRYSRTKKMPFQVLKTTSLKSRKIEIFAKGLTHGFGLKLAIFPSFFF